MGVFVIILEQGFILNLNHQELELGRINQNKGSSSPQYQYNYYSALYVPYKVLIHTNIHQIITMFSNCTVVSDQCQQLAKGCDTESALQQEPENGCIYVSEHLLSAL